MTQPGPIVAAYLVAHLQQGAQREAEGEALVVAHEVAHVLQQEVARPVEVGVRQERHDLRGAWSMAGKGNEGDECGAAAMFKNGTKFPEASAPQHAMQTPLVYGITVLVAPLLGSCEAEFASSPAAKRSPCRVAAAPERPQGPAPWSSAPCSSCPC